MNKKESRLKRARRFRARNKVIGATRLVVNRTNLHIYAQIVKYSNGNSEVIASASTVDKSLRSGINGNKIERANMVGKEIAQRAKDKGIEKVAFDRSGFKYHGRVKALAEGARESGLVF
ncbi:MAG: 50S ribosomal protein L18 [Legionellales bacterium]|nr:50S ribosomal protein L18 [Legionellales bacterium]